MLDATLASQTTMARHLELLLRIKAPVDTRDTEDATALWRASTGGHAEVVKMLIKGTADPCKGPMGRTSIWTAAQQGRLTVLKELQKAGGILNQPDNVGTTPAYIAAEKGHVACLQFLKDAGCEL